MIENGFRCNSALPDPFHPGQTYDTRRLPARCPIPRLCLPVWVTNQPLV